MLLSGDVDVVDLTRTLTPGFPTTIPDVPRVQRWQATTRESHGFAACGWTLVEHIGTHVDAPCHFVDGGRSVTDLLPDELVVPARVVDFVTRARADASAVVTVADLREEESRSGPIPRGSAVLLCAGWTDRAVSRGDYLGWDGNDHRTPGWSSEAVRWLLDERAIVALGTDTSSIDAGDARTPEAHVELLGANRYAIEGLTGLERLIGVTTFTAVVGVIPWESGTGGPCRVLALAPNDRSARVRHA